MKQQLLDELMTKAQEFVSTKNKKGMKALLNCLDKLYYQPKTTGDAVPDDIYDQLVDMYDTTFSKGKSYHELKGVGAAAGTASIDTRADIKLPYHMGTILKFSAMMVTKNKSEWRMRPHNYERKFEAWKLKYPKGPYTVEGKADGISCLLIYEKTGEKIKRTIYSRGTGDTGKDLSRYLGKTGFSMIPDGKDFEDGKTVVRGELVMRYNVWKKKYSKTFSNPRNIVGGFVTRKKNTGVKPSDIDFVAYEQLLPRDKTRFEQIQELNRLGFTTVMTTQVESLTEPGLFEILKDFRAGSPYEIDGLVVFDDSIVHAVSKVDVLPSAFAYKVNTQTAIVDVVGIEWSSSTTNALKPVVVYKPVTIGRVMPDGKVVGAVYHRATAFNAGFVKKHKIGPGAQLLIVRSGDVIPHIEEVLKPSDTPDLPNTVLDGDERYNYKGHDDIDFVWGDGLKRRSKLDIFAVKMLDATKIKQITLFFSGGKNPRGMNVKGVGEETVKKLFKNGYTSITSILQTDIEALEAAGFTKKQAENIRNPIEEVLFKKPVDLARLMGATSVFPNARKTIIKKILTKYPHVLTDGKYYGVNPAKLSGVSGVGQETLDGFVHALPDFTLFLVDNPQIKVSVVRVVKPVSAKLKDISFVFTGTMSKMNREATQELVVKNGGTTSGTVSKSTNFVVIGDSGKPSPKKIDKAENWGIKIISEKDFLKMLK